MFDLPRRERDRYECSVFCEGQQNMSLNQFVNPLFNGHQVSSASSSDRLSLYVDSEMINEASNVLNEGASN